MDMHIDRIIKERIPMIRKIHQFIPVIVGEWSLGINYEKLTKDDTFDENLYDRILASLQLYAYTQGYGYYFWNYKVENDIRDNWNLKKLVEKGVFPSKF
ncbi:MAG: hypothetical protein RG740_03475 [Acholeplasmataceae bacterium]|nr:hypothetical protein [Acholeplasmataceae bacterium]